MQKDNKQTKSYWLEFENFSSNSTLLENIQTEVCIVGAGIAGMTTAYLLTKQGKDVVVVDMKSIARGETCRTTAQITSELDERYYNLESIHGLDNTKLVAESQKKALDKIEEIVTIENIDCDFERVNAYLFTPPGEDYSELSKEFEACKKVDIPATLNDTSPVKAFNMGKNLCFTNQAQFNPLKYLQGLEKAILKNGGRIFTNTKIRDIKNGEIITITTENNHQISAKSVLVATNTPVNDILAIHTKQASYRTYVIGAKVPKGSVEKGLYWDTLDPYHYIRISEEADHDVLIVGGEDHKTGQKKDGFECFINLEAWTKSRFNFVEKIDYKWSGQVQEPADGLAFIGKNPGDASNIYIITGDSGTGMSNGTVGAMIVSDLITGKENPWAKIYDPSRKTSLLTTDFYKENMNVAAQLTDWITPGEVDSYQDIEVGKGAIVRAGLNKVAVYHHENGTFHKCSAVCPHLGCIVDWNNVENSWDCPCHGSRFNYDGKVISGPSPSDLAKL